MIATLILAGAGIPPCIAAVPGVDLFGAWVALVGDLDGGGQPDLAVGDPAWMDAPRERGRVWIVSMETGRAIRKIEPIDAARSFGWTVAALGDIDGNGKNDLAVGEMTQLFSASRRAEAAYVIALEDAHVIRRHDLAAESFLYSWHSYGPTPCVVDIGDWDKDGTSDYAIGDPGTGDPKPGYVDMFSGKDGSKLLTLRGDRPGLGFGMQLCKLPDLDGDGVLDLAVASIPADESVPSMVHVFGSHTRTPLHILNPDHATPWFGAALCAGADEDGDGKPDLWIGEPYGNRSKSGLGAGIELWSTGTWKKVRRIEPWDRSTAFEHERFGSVLLSLSGTGYSGTASVLATEPDWIQGEYVLASAKGEPQVTTSIRGKEDVSGVGVCGCMISDVDGDGVRDFAFGGVTWRGAATGAVTIWSAAKLAVISEITLASIQFVKKDK
jgi:hypothetical protein